MPFVSRSAAVDDGAGDMRGVAVEDEAAGNDDVLVDADVLDVTAFIDEDGIANAGPVDGGLNGRTIPGNANQAGRLGNEKRRQPTKRQDQLYHWTDKFDGRE